VTDAADAIRFYFSFRSPYAWLASERLEAELGDLGVPIERLPIYPTEGTFPNDPSLVPNKVAHLFQDVSRLAREQGLTLRFPSQDGVDWSLPHAAFLAAEAEGAGHAFMLEVFRKRFSEGEHLGDDAVVGAAATAAGLDADRILAAARTDALVAEAEAGFRNGIERDEIFGVPTFVYRGRLYWGQDRMRFVRSAVLRKKGET